ncbi:MAG: hypothetical protein ACTSRI_20515 [Promethearchaeota archaeon]
MDPTEETELITRNNLFIIRKKKIQDEIQAAIRILKKEVEPLEIADKFIHDTFELMKEGISHEFPELSEEELLQKVRDTLSLTRKIKALRKRGKSLG